MTHETCPREFTQKVRRGALGGERAQGWRWQRDGRRVRRPDARKLKVGHSDPTLSGVGGLADFGAFVDGLGLNATLRERFGHLKRGRQVVYPMHTQLRLLIDLLVAGARRVFDVEALAMDPVVKHLAGGAVPSVDVLYDDLQRFDVDELEALEGLMAEQGLASLRGQRWEQLTVDVDSTVLQLFGSQQGAQVGPNPRYHGRVSHHPLLATIAETGAVLGGRLRPGDTGFGGDDVEDITHWLALLRREVGPDTVVTVRIDAGGDCGEVLTALDDVGVHFIVKLHQTAAMVGAAAMATAWRTVDRDANGAPSRQVAELALGRDSWLGRPFRVIAVRSNERNSGRQVELWPGLDLSLQLFVTNDLHADADDIAWRYDGRASIEHRIGDLKDGLALGKASSWSFAANEALFLLRLLASNLMRRWASVRHPRVAWWRLTWLRRALVQVPARLLRSAGSWLLRLAPRPALE